MTDHPTDSDHNRFGRETDAAAPRPGHLLGTFSFAMGGENALMWILEGPENNALSYMAMATDFNLTRFVRFRLRGGAIQSLNDLPYSAYERRVSAEIDLGVETPTRVTGLDLVYSSVRGPNGIDPDAALICVRTEDGHVHGALTELRRAWWPFLTGFGAALALAYYTPGSHSDFSECPGTLTVTSGGSQVSGAYTYTRNP